MSQSFACFPKLAFVDYYLIMTSSTKPIDALKGKFCFVLLELRILKEVRLMMHFVVRSQQLKGGSLLDF